MKHVGRIRLEAEKSTELGVLAYLDVASLVTFVGAGSLPFALRHAIEAPSLSKDEQFQRLVKATALKHEIRHFHDMLGTPFGLARVTSGLNLIRMALCLLDAARVGGSYALPLFSKIGNVEYDASIDEFHSRRRFEMGWQAIYWAHPATSSAVEHGPSAWFADRRCMIDLASSELAGVPTEHRTIPGSRVFWTVDGAQFATIAPLNGVSITEANAVATQRRFLLVAGGERDGPDFGRRFEESLTRSIVMHPEQFQYQACSHVAAERIRPLSHAAVSQIGAWAFDGSFQDTFRAFHPGWRFMDLLDELTTSELREVIDAGEFSDEAILAAEHRLARPNSREANIEAINRWLEAHLRDLEGDESILGKGAHQIYQIAKKIVRHRLAERDPFVSTTRYVEFQNQLPAPPVIDRDSGKQLESKGINAGSLCDLSVVGSIIHDLVAGASPECPLNRNRIACDLRESGCGRVPCGKFRDHSCRFHNMLRILGIDELRAVSRSAG